MSFIDYFDGRLYHGKCEDILPTLDPAWRFDMVMCDLPYGTTACAWDSQIEFEFLWAQWERLLKPNANIVLTCCQPFTSALLMSKPFWFRCEWIWEKNTGSNFATLKRFPFKQHESVLVFAKEPGCYNPQMQAKTETSKSRAKYKTSPSSGNGITSTNKHKRGYNEEQRQSDKRYPSSVQKINRETGLHPTQKPVELFAYFIKTYSQPGDLILDNCCGVGTTAVAARATGRRFICIDSELEYFNKAKTRLQ